MKLLAVIAAALALAPAAGAISYPGAVRTSSLETRLPTRVAVFCTENSGWSFAVLADREVYLDRPTCAALAGQPSVLSFARAAHTLYHEWWHVAFQERDEKFTECGAYAVYRQMLRRFWHLTARDAQRAYAETWLWSPYAPLPCSTNATDPVL